MTPIKRRKIKSKTKTKAKKDSRFHTVCWHQAPPINSQEPPFAAKSTSVIAEQPLIHGCCNPSITFQTSLES